MTRMGALAIGALALAGAAQAQDFPTRPITLIVSFAPGTQLFALHAADGTPIMLTDTREAAVANAWSHELETVSVH